ncbi:hypothetical protein [Cryptosporangium arvum]|uniref:hypothetical protein n=1 Tax=Cryptosporangium arvum TaxID=80871 RepID=UPI0004B2AB22|nr:hypothetical protein [Cryptosporangium arvum]
MARNKTLDAWQGFAGLVGFSLGVVPLVRYAFGGRRGGLLRFVLGDDPGAALWIVPLVILGVAAVVITLLEVGKSHSAR